MTSLAATAAVRPPLWRQGSLWLGLALSGALAAVSLALGSLPAVKGIGFGALTLAILFGILLGNTVFPPIARHVAVGVDLSRSRLLRIGIILYGFRITFQQIVGVGWAGLVIDMSMIGLTFGLAYLVGTRVLRMDRQTTMLVGAGSAICGAAAVMATEPVVRAQAHKVSVAVATVVVFGTLSMLLYPLLGSALGMDSHAYGLFAGSTIHEVAQVVVAGGAHGSEAAATAVIVKMMRVMMLAPFLLILSGVLRETAEEGPDGAHGAHGKRRITIPWFAFAFIAVAGVNSLGMLPEPLVSALVTVDSVLLAMAMAALGLRTHLGAVRQAGVKPLVLAGMLFVFLVVGGYAVNAVVLHLLG